MIEANAQNRAVAIVAESTEFYRSSEIQLDGEHAPRTTTFEFRSLPPGTYEVTATLIGSDGSALATVRQQMNVIRAARVGSRSESESAVSGDAAVGSPHHDLLYNALLGRAPATTFSGSGVKSSPGLMKRSFSNRYCLSYSCR